MLTLALALSLATVAAPAIGAAEARAAQDSDPGAAPASTDSSAALLAVAHPAPASPAPSLALAPIAASAITPAAALDSFTKSGNIGIQTNSASTAAMPFPGAELSTKGFPTGSILPLLGFGLAAGLTLAFARRKQQAAPKLLSIVETHSLGGRRQLIVARISGETVLLGSSEAGLSLLLARPGETVEELRQSVMAQTAITQTQAQGGPARSDKSAKPATLAEKAQQTLAAALGKLRLAGKDEEEELEGPSFEELLEEDARLRAQGAPRSRIKIDVEPALLRQPIDPDGESAEDLELRRKLAAGRAGRVA